jgi:sugar lactone lactonase YvrE
MIEDKLKNAALEPGEFTAIASGLYLEGLAVDYARNLVWYSDVIGGGIHAVTFEGDKVTVLNPERMWTGGVMLNADGAVLSSGQHGIMWNHPDTGKSGWLIDAIDGVPLGGINEMWPDGEGGIFFGTIDMDAVIAGREAAPASIYRLTRDRKVLLAAENIGFSNGLAYDAARRRLYANATFTRTWVFDVAPDLTLSNRRSLLEKDDVDGMALDAEGNVWITGFRSNFITRLTPDGTSLPPVQTPAGSITQVRFGGADMRDYVLCSVPADGGDTLKEGGQITEARSVLYRGRSEVAGLPIEPAQFALN